MERVEHNPSATARRELMSRGGPFFSCSWDRVLMIHYAVDARRLAEVVPFDLDVREGVAYVSAVAFSMRDFRLAKFGRLGGMVRLLRDHQFLNIRTYVRRGDEVGIYFLVEWLNNALAVRMGPALYGLPYRGGRLEYGHNHEAGVLRGRVRDGKVFEYVAAIDPLEAQRPCEEGTVEHFLMERYTAFTRWHGVERAFRIWHEPWPQVPVDVGVIDDGLIRSLGSWFESAELVGGNYCARLEEIWMGAPQRVDLHQREHASRVCAAPFRVPRRSSR